MTAFEVAYGAVAAARKLISVAADLIWPPRSLLSAAIVDRPGLIEPALWRELRFLGPPCCAQCGFPFERAERDDALCGACAAEPPAFDAARAALAYDDLSRTLVLEMKRAGRRDGLPAFAAWMRQAGGDLVARADFIVPTPLHWTRLARRTFNQSAWLAAALARAAGKPMRAALLVRTKRRRSQAGLSAKQRRDNVRGAFAVAPRWRSVIAGRTVLLVDDVFTTGATLDACARALKKAGAARVDAITLARVVRPVGLAI